MVINYPLSPSSIFYDPRHLPCSIYVPYSLFPQSLQVFFGLPLGLAPSTSYSIHFFTQWFSSFHNTCPYERNLFCCSIEIMSSNPSLCLNAFLGTLSCSLMLKYNLIFLSYEPGLTFMEHTTSYTKVVKSPSHYQWYIVIGKQWYQLPEFIPSTLSFNSLSLLISSPSVSAITTKLSAYNDVQW